MLKLISFIDFNNNNIFNTFKRLSTLIYINHRLLVLLKASYPRLKHICKLINYTNIS